MSIITRGFEQDRIPTRGYGEHYEIGRAERLYLDSFVSQRIRKESEL